jgi:hypothetical protein
VSTPGRIQTDSLPECGTAVQFPQRVTGANNASTYEWIGEPVGPCPSAIITSAVVQPDTKTAGGTIADAITRCRRGGFLHEHLRRVSSTIRL